MFHPIWFQRCISCPKIFLEEVSSHPIYTTFTLEQLLRIHESKVTKNRNYHGLRENISACLFSVHNTITLSRHEEVCS